jgi:putative membrane protein
MNNEKVMKKTRHIYAIILRDNKVYKHEGGFYMMLIFVVIIGILVFYLMSNEKNENNRLNLPGKKTPEDILKEKYVNGEITEEEYLKRKKVIGG